MGVPSFYRWLVNKYPKIVSDATASVGVENPPEFDNLYLDMNGIIHPCFHPEDDPFPPTTFDEVFGIMHVYIDHLFDIVKPKKLLFMAIDGVAPRAKMNQQRTRRFRAAKEAEIAEETEERLRKLFESEGKFVLPKQASELDDTNVITPGTEFMHILSENLRSYIGQRINDNPAWGNIKVILSDDKVPGEGEHKIMSFIRAQRASPGYDPNTKHCLYGLDADLIMLALATHEVHFSILREEVMSPQREFSNGTYLDNSGCASTTDSVKSRGWFKEHPGQISSHESVIDTAKLASSSEAHFRVSKRQSYQYLNVSILREYLALDMEVPGLEKFEHDLERIIDDFIFICFFAGNDFLPHIPSLEIHEGCIDLLMHVYKNEVLNHGGYLVNMQEVDDKKGRYIKLKQVEKFILAVGAYEDKIFSKRVHLRDRKLSRILAEYRDAKKDEDNFMDEGTSSEIVGMHNVVRIDTLKISSPPVDDDAVLNNTKELKQKVKDYIRKQSDLFKDGCFGTDKVKLSTPGWRERYYEEKFSAESPPEMETMRKSLVEKYGEGLCWVMLYYFSGVPSWTWFYPYHYGPFASDFRGLSQLKAKFQKGLPFKPFDQLMGVLPPRSSHALPLSYKKLMVDDKSELIDLYPAEFDIDIDGKRFLWQGICKLPFIEEERLLTETRKIENELKDVEKLRNLQTLDLLFLSRSSKSSQQLLSCRARGESEKIKGALVMDSEIDGIKGSLHVMHDDLIETDEDTKHRYIRNDAICMFYEVPQGFWNVPRLLEGVNIPEKIVNKDDVEETVLWHERHGSSSYSRSNYMSQSRQPDFLSSARNPPAGAGHGFSLGRGKASAFVGPSETPSQSNAVGSFRPSYRGYGFRGQQSSASTYTPRTGTSRSDGYGGDQRSVPNYGYTSNYRPQGAAADSWGRNGVELSQQRSVPNHGYTSNYRPQGGAADSWRRNNVELSQQRSVPNHGYTSNHRPQGVGCNSWRRNDVELSQQRQQTHQWFATNGGRGQGRGRGWSTTQS